MIRPCTLVFALAVMNFVAFFVIATRLGGDALNGNVVDGHYFLGSHGHLTEVSAGRCAFSLWHARSVFVTHALGILAGAYCVLSLKPARRIGK